MNNLLIHFCHLFPIGQSLPYELTLLYFWVHHLGSLDNCGGNEGFQRPSQALVQWTSLRFSACVCWGRRRLGL